MNCLDGENLISLGTYIIGSIISPYRYDIQTLRVHFITAMIHALTERDGIGSTFSYVVFECFHIRFLWLHQFIYTLTINQLFTSAHDPSLNLMPRHGCEHDTC